MALPGISKFVMIIVALNILVSFTWHSYMMNTELYGGNTSIITNILYEGEASPDTIRQEGNIGDEAKNIETREVTPLQDIVASVVEYTMPIGKFLTAVGNLLSMVTTGAIQTGIRMLSLAEGTNNPIASNSIKIFVTLIMLPLSIISVVIVWRLGFGSYRTGE